MQGGELSKLVSLSRFTENVKEVLYLGWTSTGNPCVRFYWLVLQPLKGICEKEYTLSAEWLAIYSFFLCFDTLCQNELLFFLL